MAEYGSALPPGTDLSQFNQSAGDLMRASFAGYGVAPDPQLSAESLLTGSSPALSYTLAQGTPGYARALLSTPIGQTPQMGSAPPALSLYNDPYSWDPKQYQQLVQRSDPNKNTFKSMGEAPIANLGWLKSIENGDQNTVKRWQQFLANNGYYGDRGADGKHFKKGEVNGYATQQFKDGLNQWALSYFLPTALFSRDPAENTQARQFLSGLGFDSDSIAKTMAYDPAQRAKVIDGWLQAQGPGANKVQALNLFADHFGKEALPEQLNSLRGDGIFGGIGDFLHHVIPFIGSSDEEKLKKLTPAEQELLAPSLQQAHNQSGFIKFMGDVFSAPSKALITTGLFFGHAVSGDVENPFDDQSKIRQTADSFVNNPMAKIFGDQFVKDHPWLSTFGNIAVGVFDDPLTYIPFIGEANLIEKVSKGAGESIKGFETMTKAQQKAALVEAGRLTKVEAATGGLISHKVGSLRYGAIAPRTVIGAIKDRDAGRITAKFLNPIETAQEEMAKALTKKNLDHGMIRTMLNLNHDADFDKVEEVLRLGQTGADGAHMDVLDYLRNPANGLADRLFSMDMLVHRHQYDNVLKNIANWSAQKAAPLGQLLRMNDAGALLLADNPSTVVNTLRDMSMAAGGIAPQRFQQFATEFWKKQGDTAGRLKLAQGMVDEIKTAWDQTLKAGGKGQSLAAYMKHRELMSQNSRSFKGRAIMGMEHDVTKPAEETSLATTTKFEKDSGAYTADQLNEMMAGLETSRDTLLAEAHGMAAAARESLGEVALTDPYTLEKIAAHGEAAQDLQKQIDAMIAEHSGTTASRPIPMHSTQSALYLHLPFTPTEMATYMNPVLRKANAFQRRSGIDKAMNMWKIVTLGKPATSLRIIFGDESSRGHIHLLLNDPGEWAKYMKNVLTHKGYNPERFMAEHPELIKTSHVLNQLGAGRGKYVPMVAGDKKYRASFVNLLENHYGKQEWPKVWANAVEKPLKEGGDWEQAGKDALREFFQSKHPDAVFQRGIAHAANFPGSKTIDELAETRHHDLATLTHPDPKDADRMQVFQWLKKGVVDRDKLKALENKVKGTTDDAYVLPRVQGISPIMGTPVGNFYDWYHEKVADWVAHARGRVYGAKYEVEHKRLSKFYSNELREGRMDPADISRMADSSAATWVEKNTYQGSRTILGSTLRTIAPFWGATANSNKFYLHTLMEHPEALPAFAKGEHAITEAQEDGGLRVHLNFLSKLGFASGDNFSFEPFNPLFLTREGFGGLIPGAGPVFNVGMSWLPQSVKDWVGENVPGMEYAAHDSPMMSWATNLVSAVGLAIGKNGFEAPFVGRSPGYFDKLVDQKLQQMEATWEQGGRKGSAPTIQDAKNDVAKEQALTGLLGAATPTGAGTDDVKATAIHEAQQKWDPNLSPEDKKTFFAEIDPGVVDFFKYIDPHTPQNSKGGKESKAEILKRSPWVEAYTVGKGESEVAGRATLADTAEQYKRDVEAGNIRTLKPTEYLQKMRTQEQMDQAWNSFDYIQNQYQQFLLESGVSTNSKEAQAWRKQYYDPNIKTLVNEFPEWGSTFVKQTSQSAVGQQFASKPFYSVSTFNVIPRNPALETKATTLWRAALVRRDQATSALEQAMARGGSQHEKEMILQGLTQQLDQLAAQDPVFASQISRYRYSNLSDLINFEAGQAVTAAEGYPVG